MDLAFSLKRKSETASRGKKRFPFQERKTEFRFETEPFCRSLIFTDDLIQNKHIYKGKHTLLPQLNFVVHVLLALQLQHHDDDYDDGDDGDYDDDDDDDDDDNDKPIFADKTLGHKIIVGLHGWIVQKRGERFAHAMPKTVHPTPGD